MAKSVPIVLTATAVSFSNEWLQGDFNLRIPMAGALAALLLDGIEHVSEELGTGLAVILLITTLLTPFGRVRSPIEELLWLSEGKQ